MMVGNNLKDAQLQQIVDKTIIYADKDGDGKINFDEFKAVRCSFFAVALASFSMISRTPCARLQGLIAQVISSLDVDTKMSVRV